MSSLRLPLLSELIFPLVLRAAEKPGLGFSWETAVKRAKWANISLFIHTCEQTCTQTGKQTHVRSNTIGKVRGSALPDTHGASLPENLFFIIIIIKAKFHSLVCSAAYLCQPCVRRPCRCLWRLYLPGETVWGCFFECLFLEIPVFGLYTLEADTFRDVTSRFFKLDRDEFVCQL